MYMTMTLNDALTKQNFITKVLFKNDTSELSKELKVKLMRIRIAYNKIKEQFNSELEQFKKEIVSDELINLLNKEDKTIEEAAKLEELTNKANSEIKEFILQKSTEEVELGIDDSFTESEYDNLVEVNIDNTIEINNVKISGPDFLEGLYSLFVK